MRRGEERRGEEERGERERGWHGGNDNENDETSHRRSCGEEMERAGSG